MLDERTVSLQLRGTQHAPLTQDATRGATRRTPAGPDRRPYGRIDPEHEALLADSVGLALLVVLETLTPAERLAYVLHDMFSVPFDEIDAILDRSPAADAAASAVRTRPPTPTRLHSKK